jgi:hypothetical protein
LARPSQNWAVLKTALNTVGELRPPFCDRWPSEVEAMSVPPRPMLWHEAQLMAWFADSRGSKYSIFPGSTFSFDATLPGRSGARFGIGLKSACARSTKGSMVEAGALVGATTLSGVDF